MSRPIATVCGDIHLVWEFHNESGFKSLQLRLDKCEMFRNVAFATISRAETEDGIPIKGKYWSFGADIDHIWDDDFDLDEADRLDLAMRICEDFVIAGIR